MLSSASFLSSALEEASTSSASALRIWSLSSDHHLPIPALSAKLLLASHSCPINSYLPFVHLASPLALRGGVSLDVRARSRGMVRSELLELHEPRTVSWRCLPSIPQAPSPHPREPHPCLERGRHHRPSFPRSRLKMLRVSSQLGFKLDKLTIIDDNRITEVLSLDHTLLSSNALSVPYLARGPY